jgi:RimJ/RimL family protein N-acetyltransferase
MITIEPLEPADFALAAEWLSNPAINRWLTVEWRNRDANSTTLAMAVRNKRNRLFLVRNDSQPCGLVALADLDPGDRTAMIWYLLGDVALGGKGVTTAAVGLLVQRAFAEHSLASLYAWAMDDNSFSKRVLEKAGFKQVGRLRQSACSVDRQVDRVYFDMTADEAARLAQKSEIIADFEVTRHPNGGSNCVSTL